MKKADLVREKLPLIARLRLTKHTWKEIAAQLVEEGLSVSENEIRGYWGRFAAGRHPTEFLMKQSTLDEIAAIPTIVHLEKRLTETRSNLDEASRRTSTLARDLKLTEFQLNSSEKDVKALNFKLSNEQERYQKLHALCIELQKSRDEARKTAKAEYERGKAEAQAGAQGGFDDLLQGLTHQIDGLSKQLESATKALTDWQKLGRHAAVMYRDGRREELHQAIAQMGKWTRTPVLPVGESLHESKSFFRDILGLSKPTRPK